MRTSHVRSMLAGVLVANSAPHIASAATNRQHLTPLAGKQSGPVVNGIWAVANLTGSAVALRACRSPEVTRWGKDLLAFEAGYLAWAVWMAGSERLFATNTDSR